MPELPEVKTVVKGLNQLILNKTIKNIVILREKIIKEISPKQFKETLIGLKVKKVTNKGKFIIFHFNNKNILMLSHLRMEGKYFYFDHNTKPEKHIHVIFKFTDDSELQYKDTRVFGTFHIRKNNYKTVLPLSKLANEPKNTEPKILYNRIKNRRIAIKSILIDQTILVGLGNIYVDEVLFAAKIDPTRPCNTITLKELNLIIKYASSILKEATRQGGSSIMSYTSINNQKGTYQNFLKVHTQKGKPCVKCKKVIEKIKVNGRGTYYCTNCQK
jgi:formamidopyrimidine-DNA glycosylase